VLFQKKLAALHDYTITRVELRTLPILK